MNYGEFIIKVLDTVKDKDYLYHEVEVYFDFPLHGTPTRYKVVSVSGAGIVIKNTEVNRPLGHE
jgi:hypothetical protein